MSSDGIYGDGDRRRGGGRRGREDRDGDRRGMNYEDELKYYILRVYKEYSNMYKTIKEESEKIRKHSKMRLANRKLRDKDKKDIRSLRPLKDNDDPIDMLKLFNQEAKNVTKHLNEKFRAHFYQSSGRDFEERSSPRGTRHRGDDRRESRGDGHRRRRSSNDRDRQPRERRERRDDRGHEGRSSRHRRRRYSDE